MFRQDRAMRAAARGFRLPGGLLNDPERNTFVPSRLNKMGKLQRVALNDEFGSEHVRMLGWIFLN